MYAVYSANARLASTPTSHYPHAGSTRRGFQWVAPFWNTEMAPEKFSLAVQKSKSVETSLHKNIIDLAQNKVMFLLDFLIIYTYGSVL